MTSEYISNNSSESNDSITNLSYSCGNTNIFSCDSDSIIVNKDIQKIFNKKHQFLDNKTVYNNYYHYNKLTSPYITKYEKTKIIGIRAQMLANGSKPLVRIPNDITSCIDIAEIEFNEKKIPLIIRRHITNDKYEDWRLEDFN